MEKIRCPWCGTDPDYVRYHDEEWGVPLRDDRSLFALLILEGAQAGLSWLTILKRRQGYFAAFEGLDPERMAAYGPRDVERLMLDARIIRNRRKIESAIGNARAYLELKRREGSFSDWLWARGGGEPAVDRPETMADVPASTPASAALSKELVARGFTFVGPTIIYAFMQSAGMVDDHLRTCFRSAGHPHRGDLNSGLTEN